MPSANNPKISVVMPTYNSEATISNAINSILNQTFQDFELIIVDDGSTDNTIAMTAKFIDPRIRTLNQHHQGIVPARNKGNSEARGKIIVLQDADDLSMPDRLKKCFDEITKGADVVYHGIYENAWHKKFLCINRSYIAAESFNKFRLLQGQYIPGACVFRKKCWEQKPFRMETMYAFDFAMHLDWAFSGFRYKALNEGLYEYVRQSSSASITYEKDGRRAESMKAIALIMKKEYNQTLI